MQQRQSGLKTGGRGGFGTPGLKKFLYYLFLVIYQKYSKFYLAYLF